MLYELLHDITWHGVMRYRVMQYDLMIHDTTHHSVEAEENTHGDEHTPFTLCPLDPAHALCWTIDCTTQALSHTLSLSLSLSLLLSP